MTGNGFSSEEVSSGGSTLQTGATRESSRSPQLVLIEDGLLFSLQSRPPIRQYTKDLWGRRHFIKAQARAKSLRTGQDTFLGRLWIILTPVISIAIYSFVFGVVLNVSRGMENFVGFLTLGVVYFGFFTKSISSGSGLIRSSRNMIAAFSFPNASLALSAVLRQFVDNLTPAVVAVLGCVLLQLDQPIHWTIIFVLPLFLLIHIFGLGVCFIGARATAFIPDLKSIISVVNRGLFFVSGVFFTIERFETNDLVTKIVEANPIYQFLQAIRNCVMAGQVPSLQTWAYISIWSFGLLIFGYWYFWRAEERYASVK